MKPLRQTLRVQGAEVAAAGTPCSWILGGEVGWAGEVIESLLAFLVPG